MISEFDASMLAKEMRNLGPLKNWKVTSIAWVELMSYAASRSRGNAHIQQLSKGVWLESLETRFRAKLIVFFFFFGKEQS